MKNLLIDTRDSVEKKWARTVCKHYPEYSYFWNEFIGVRNSLRARRLVWYEYKYPQTWDRNKKSRFTQNIEELFMAHYSLFCNLAGAHFQLKTCLKSLKTTNIADRHFKYWESFECCYQHMGNVINYFYFFWEKLFSLTGKNIPRQRNGDLSKSAVDRELSLLFISKKKISLYKSSKTYFGRKGQIATIRNNIVHYARLSTSSIGDKGYLLPNKISSNIRWSKAGPFRKGFLAHKKAEMHLIELETIINKLQIYAKEKLREHLVAERILIKY